LINYHSL